MNKIAPISAMTLLAVSACGVRAKTEHDMRAHVYPPNNESVCLLAGAPPSDIRFEVLGKIVATKRTYGSTEELYPSVVYEARKVGADAVINLQAKQRVKGPLPWRIAAPTGGGVAIKVLPDSPKLDCEHVGGQLAK